MIFFGCEIRGMKNWNARAKIQGAQKIFEKIKSLKLFSKKVRSAKKIAIRQKILRVVIPSQKWPTVYVLLELAD